MIGLGSRRDGNIRYGPALDMYLLHFLPAHLAHGEPQIAALDLRDDGRLGCAIGCGENGGHGLARARDGMEGLPHLLMPLVVVPRDRWSSAIEPRLMPLGMAPITPATTGPVPMPTWICRRARLKPERVSM